MKSIINPNSTNIKLTYKEELHLLLMALAPKYECKEIFLKPLVGLLKNESIFHAEKIAIIKSVIQLEVDNFLDDDDKKELDGEIKMTKESEDIILQVTREVNKKYEQEAIDEAERKGIDEGKKKMIKNLKGRISPEELSKASGFSISTILLLWD